MLQALGIRMILCSLNDLEYKECKDYSREATYFDNPCSVLIIWKWNQNKVTNVHLSDMHPVLPAGGWMHVVGRLQESKMVCTEYTRQNWPKPWAYSYSSYLLSLTLIPPPPARCHTAYLVSHSLCNPWTPYLSSTSQVLGFPAGTTMPGMNYIFSRSLLAMFLF